MSLKEKILGFVLRGAIEKDGFRRKLVMWKAQKVVNNYMDGKSKWKSKAVWTAIVGVIIGAIQPVSTALGHPVEVPAWAYQILGAFGLYAVRDGMGKPLQ